MKVKICGIKTIEDIQSLNRYKPDFAGFVLSKRSKRFVSYERAVELMRSLDPAIRTVGVFLDNPVGEIETYAAFDFWQLHGYREDETPKGRKIIRAYSVKTREDIARAERSEADYILLDHGLGGTGKQFDWSLLDVKRDFFLAGGLNEENLKGLPVRPFALDVSSGVETDGKKDDEKIRRFIESARRL